MRVWEGEGDSATQIEILRPIKVTYPSIVQIV